MVRIRGAGRPCYLRISQVWGILVGRDCHAAIASALKPDFEILLLQLELRDGVLFHQVNDGFDVF